MLRVAMRFRTGFRASFEFGAVSQTPADATLPVVKVTFLGTGTSVGVPVIGCSCKVCTSPDPRNRRLRPSIWIQEDDLSVLVDTSTDLRQQALEHAIQRVDAVLYTHAHADHILGLDELRIYNFMQRQTMPVYGSEITLASIQRTFWYAFEDVPKGGGVPLLDLHTVDGPFHLGSLEVLPVPLFHGPTPILGFRFGDFAYCTDVNRIPEESYPLLEGLDTLVLDALRPFPHPTHFTVEQAVAEVEKLNPRVTYLTHMTHDLEFHALDHSLPDDIHPAHDGLVLEFD